MIPLFLSVVLATIASEPISVKLNAHSFSQGETVRIEVNAVGESCQLFFDGALYPLYGADGPMVGLIGIPADFSAGAHRLELTSGSAGCTIDLEVKPSDYSSEKIVFPEEKKDLLKVDISHERKIIREALSKEGRPRLWRSPFLMPVEGRISSAYGTRRNGGYHRGVDISAKSGTLIAAPARGTATITGDFPIHGKTLVLDHGEGVSTIYCHLDTILVRQGDRAEAGSPLARVGNTGLGTAPHLHWGLYIHGIPVNPMTWLTEDY